MVPKAPRKGLSRFEELTLVGGEELERALGWVAQRIDRFVHHKHLSRVDLSSWQEWLDFYAGGRWARGETFFEEPRSLPLVTEEPLFELPGGEVVDLSFESQYEPRFERAREEFLSFAANRVFHGRMWWHKNSARATIVALHGWTMDDARVTSLAFLPGVFYKLGLNMVIVDLPFHGRRSVKDSQGEKVIFPGPHIARTNEGIAQSIHDLRILRRWLDAKGLKTVGCMGMSLGGYLSALWASLEELAFAVLIVPVADLAALAWEVVSMREEFEEILSRGITEGDLERAFNIHCPLRHTPKLPINRRMIVAGLADHIVPARHPHLLWEHWGYPEIHWLSGGHLAHFKRSGAVQKISEFFARLGYTEGES